MRYQADKISVLDFFENHILKYVVVDLEVLDKIKADSYGLGGCAIPQASSTFAALELMGYLIHPQDTKTVAMSFSDLLNNEKYFPEFKKYATQSNFLNSFRDNLRSIMVHRFSLVKYDISKTDDNHIFIEKDGRQIFNTSYFTKLTINTIKKIHIEIRNDAFFINGYSKEVTLEKMKNRIDKLKDFESENYVTLTDLPPSTTATETTSSLG
jgi:hypothetical protein